MHSARMRVLLPKYGVVSRALLANRMRVTLKAAR